MSTFPQGHLALHSKLASPSVLAELAFNQVGLSLVPSELAAIFLIL